MAVIQIKGRTTNKPEEFSKYSFSSNSLLFTSALPDNIENFSIELTLGEGWNDNYSDSNLSLRQIDDEITIGGRESIVVEVTEEIRVPLNRYGIVVPTGSLFLAQGLLIASAKVEPAFSGKLKLRLFNTTNSKIKLKKGRKLGSVIFFSTEAAIYHDTINRDSKISVSKNPHFKNLCRWFGENKTTWIGWLISAVIPWSVAIFLFINYYQPALNKKQDEHSAPQSLRSKSENKGTGKENDSN
ncbi:dCTP deaminase domain-containing protein [Pseudomonas nitroreducens]|uniref:dCTP deaminase domain-containing protein n=1 Tax=Pseudomonas nitroreducens TaxID=46680 RepID=UPI00265A5205|nr:dUTP pyrophosphatase [Pseudomonas nitroreducens]MCP1651523.1 deoxycytidine triphosphate deaminase [Pseudomonas nitroreducens]MCP1689251.1 deoxycytidine triphosphate deaminase [Pseudomonas nitroreducens]